ncbi:MAG TPA: YbhB/YbcL family Raf kinase inhibitor-like protein [Solirubrobacteraceae bacterium]|nr:YbhB/YbcL family Raf kinase inhibitor-like protein [Solirubrobacteraceae bacterium]
MSSALVLGLAVAGCGSSSSTSSSTQAGRTSHASSSQQTGTGADTTATSSRSKEHVPTVTIKVSSPAYRGAGAIHVRYTCDGADASLPLQWSTIPKGIAELVLFVTDFNEKPQGGETFFSWAVAGLHPTLRGLAGGTLPAGAIVGRNSFGQSRYSVCPPKGGGVHHFLVVLYALPHSVSAQPGFAANALLKTVTHAAEYSGLSGFAYKRG